MSAIAPSPSTCSNVVPGTNRQDLAYCGADLTAVPDLPAPPILIESTRRLHAKLAGLDTAEGRADLKSTLHDYRILAYFEGQRLSIPTSPEIIADREALGDVLETASAALLDPAGSAFEKTALVGVDFKIYPPEVLPKAWLGASLGLRGRVIAIRREAARPTHRIRWVASSGGHLPDGDAERLRAVSQRLPISLWPEWSARLLPLTSLPPHAFFRRVAATALLLPNSELTIPQLCAAFPEAGVHEQDFNRCLRELERIPGGSVAIDTIAELGDYLRTNPPPINYERRRQIPIDEELLHQHEWMRYCLDGQGPWSNPNGLPLARIWLWEALTGGSFRQAPYGLLPDELNLNAFHGGGPAGRYQGFLRGLTPRMRALLRAHAEHALEDRGITDEPLDWEPPLDAVTQRSWGGVELGDFDLAELGNHLSSGEALTAVASALGVTLEHMRLLVRFGDFRVDTAPSKFGPKHIPEDELRDMVAAQGITARAAAAIFGVNRKTIYARCDQLGIKRTPVAGHSDRPSDPGWLEAQYVDLARTLPEIAAAAGCSTSTVARAARVHGMELRPAGGASHRSAIRIDPLMPPLLAMTVRGQGGVDRAKRFRVIARSRSLCDAARQLGVAQSVLSTQLAKLERQAGGALMTRATAQHQAQGPTALGSRLLHQIERQYGVAASKRSPREPLRAALRLYRGAARVDKFVAIADAGSVREAADILGTDPSTLVRSWNAFETALGTDLIMSKSRKAPLELTPTGLHLVRQARNTAA